MPDDPLPAVIGAQRITAGGAEIEAGVKFGPRQRAVGTGAGNLGIQRVGIERAAQTLEGVQGAWIKEQKVIVEGGRIKAYRTVMKVSFLLQG